MIKQSVGSIITVCKKNDKFIFPPISNNILSLLVNTAVISRLLLFKMFQEKSVCFFLFLTFVAVSHVVLSTWVNKTTADGKVFITGDHNEVVVSTARETKFAPAEIKKTKLQITASKRLSPWKKTLKRNWIWWTSRMQICPCRFRRCLRLYRQPWINKVCT